MRLTEAERRALADFADGHEHTVADRADFNDLRPRQRGSYGGAVMRLYRKGALSLRWTSEHLFFRITPAGIAALAEDGGE